MTMLTFTVIPNVFGASLQRGQTTHKIKHGFFPFFDNLFLIFKTYEKPNGKKNMQYSLENKKKENLSSENDISNMKKIMNTHTTQIQTYIHIADRVDKYFMNKTKKKAVE